MERKTATVERKKAMSQDKGVPLGYVELPSGPKAIYPMNDIFLNYHYENPENWETLREIVNITVEAYQQINPVTLLEQILGLIEVQTQYKQVLEDGKTTREQDMRMVENLAKALVNFTYVEFQNRANTKPPIPIRGEEYFGLAIGHARGQTANQIWFLAEDVEVVLHGKTFARYILKDEVTGTAYPTKSGILYVSLTKLSQESGTAGELASFLLGKLTNPTDERVKKIMASINGGFEKFKIEKDVVKVLSFRERWRNEDLLEGEARGEARGKAEGKAEGISILAELIRNGHTLEEALAILDKETTATA